MIYAGLGDKDRGLEWLGNTPHFNPSTPEWSSLYADSRFDALAKKMRKQ